MKKRIVRAIWAVAVACLALWCLWGNTALTVTSVEVFGERLPRSFDGYRIVQLSDLHDARFGAQNERLIERVAAQQPSAIVLTGDMIDSRRTKVEPTIALAQRLAELAPVYYVTGNHEARIPEAAQVLRSEAVDLQEGGESIRLIGLDDLGVYYQALSGDSSDRQALSAAKEALKRDLSTLAEGSGYALVLSHRPELIDLYAECGADLVLCGHAHGGQVRLPFIGGLYAPGQGLFPAWDAGLYETGGTQMFVSRGLGNSAFPLRVNNRPEVVTITLRRAN